jgi:hypothetical protein
MVGQELSSNFIEFSAFGRPSQFTLKISRLRV